MAPFQVLVMCDPYGWYEAAQVSIDVLCSSTPLSKEYDPLAPPMPIHFSNPDFLSKFEHPYPRFAQAGEEHFATPWPFVVSWATTDYICALRSLDRSWLRFSLCMHAPSWKFG